MPPPHWVRYRLERSRLSILDLATTKLPAFQTTDFEAFYTDSQVGTLTVQL
jgi:hypothetical protein